MSAEGTGVDKENLVAQLDRFNENARNGVDPDFHRYVAVKHMLQK